METSTLILAIAVAVAVVGQAGLIWWGNAIRRFDDRQLAEARARLLEDAADRQTLATSSQSAKLDGKGGGDV